MFLIRISRDEEDSKRDRLDTTNGAVEKRKEKN